MRFLPNIPGMFLVFFILLASGLASPGNAAGGLLPCFSRLLTPKHPKVSFTNKEGFIASRSDQEAVLSVFEEMASLTESPSGVRKLLLPENITVELAPPGDVGHHVGDLIQLSTRYSGSARKARTVLAHEWSHELLETNLKYRFPQIMRGSEFKGDKGLFKTYSEVFADAVPVVWLKDGRVPAKPVYSATLKGDERLVYQTRDFTRNFPVKGWAYEGAYSIFSPTKSWLWKNYLSRSQVQRAAADAVDALVDAIGNELKWRLSKPGVVLSPEELNLRLMREIARQMDRRGLGP